MRRVLAVLSCFGVARALHASLAYPSRLSLPSLPVKQVCIDCQKPEDDPREWRDKIRRRAARCGCGYREGTTTVVFASDPTPANLAVLCGDDGTARQPEDTVLEPVDRRDWPVYDRLLLSDLSRHLRDHGVEKDYGLLWLPLAGETFEASKFVIKRGINVGLTTFVDTRGECRLLMPLNVKHHIEAKESLYSMLQREPFDSLLTRNIKVKTRSGIYPSFSGTLCLPTVQGSISAPRTDLNSQSLIEYSNSKGDKRRIYLKTEPDPDAVAVGLKRAAGDVMDYPPQLLEPAFDNELPLTARRYMKLSPGDWVEKTTSIQELLSDWRPNFATMITDAAEPFLADQFLWEEFDFPIGMLDCAKSMIERNLLRNGPELPTNCSAVLLPIYPAKYADKVNRLVNNLRKRCFQKWTHRRFASRLVKNGLSSMMRVRGRTSFELSAENRKRILCWPASMLTQIT